MGELMPCPLCGSTNVVCFAEECGDSYDGTPTFRAVVGCCGCHEEGCDPDYDEEPCFGIEAYFRDDHPLIRYCEDPSDCERVLEQHMAERWNRRADLIDPGDAIPGEACELEGAGDGEPLPTMVDHEALLALAGKIDDGRTQRERQQAGERWFIDGLDVREYARRIREALGVE